VQVPSHCQSRERAYVGEVKTVYYSVAARCSPLVITLTPDDPATEMHLFVSDSNPKPTSSYCRWKSTEHVKGEKQIVVRGHEFSEGVFYVGVHGYEAGHFHLLTRSGEWSDDLYRDTDSAHMPVSQVSASQPHCTFGLWEVEDAVYSDDMSGRGGGRPGAEDNGTGMDGYASKQY
jgi:hypothetical protein